MRNISTKADNVGDVLPATGFNALNSELENAVTSSGQTLDPDGGPDTDVEMLGKAITIYANASQYYQDSGTANSYVLARVGNLKPLVDYIDGTTVVFKAGNANTGSSTINVDSLGAKDLVDNTGAALVGGEVVANGYTIARYNSSTDDFEIIAGHSSADLPVPASGNEYMSPQVNSSYDGYELAGPLTSFKNKIINGNFDLWDYATSQTSSGYGSDNRWINTHSGSTKTHTRQAFTLGQTDVPGNPEYYSRTVVTTASGASDYVRKSQRIEFVKTFSGETVTLSFWAKADAAKDIAVEFSQNFGTSGSPSAQVNSIGVTTLSLTTSWAKYTVTADIPSISGKTLGTDLNDYLMLTFWFDAGSDYNARTNSLGNQSGTFDVSQVQVEAGPVETVFEDRHLEVEKLLAGRFYEEVYTDADKGAFITYTTNGDTRGILCAFKYEKRVIPSVTESAGSWAAIYFGTGGSSITGTVTPSVYATSTKGAALNIAATELNTYGSVVSWGTSTISSIYADAEL